MGHPIFGSHNAFEASDRLLQRQLEQYGSDLSDAVNKLRDMANVARSDSLRASILAKIEQTVGCWQDNLQVLESTLLRTFPRAPAIGDSSCSVGHGICGNHAASIPLPLGWDSALGVGAYNKSGYDDIYQIFHHAARDWSEHGLKLATAVRSNRVAPGSRAGIKQRRPAHYRYWYPGADWSASLK